jgi:hypothetical protein
VARSVATSLENSFVNGLVTEATGLNFPENACTEATNVEFDQKGVVSRRKGFDFEDGYDTLTVSRSGKAINTFLWKAAAGSGDNNFVVMQVGSSLYLYAQGTTGEISPNALASTIDISSFKVAGAPAIDTIECQFATGFGYLFVVHPYCEPFYVEYDVNAGTFSGTAITVKIRDTDGLEDTDDVEFRPTTMTPTKYYNLFNQGWVYEPKYSTNYTYAQLFHYFKSKWPSNADVWWTMKNAEDVFAAANFDSQARGNSPAPKGHAMLSAFYQDRSSLNSDFAGVPVVSSGYYRPSTVEFFAGRVFYAGVDAQGFSNKIYFSQIVESSKQFGKCHQKNDPTSEIMFDLLATDGGVVTIPEAGTIIKLFSMASALLVFASNGIWSISGSSGTGFAANDFKVEKLSDTPSISASSFVSVAGVPAWWNTDGIYTIAMNQTLGQSQVNSMTEKKIKAFFGDIPPENKRYPKGVYNPESRVVQWVYRTANAASVDDRYNYDSVLSFNVNTGAFYPWTVPNTNVRLNGIVVTSGSGSQSTTTDVLTNTLQTVTDTTADPVTVEVVTAATVSSVTKYLCSYTASGNNLFTWAETLNEDYKDWVTYDGVGVNYDSSFTSGYILRGEAQRKFQDNYLFVYLDNTEALSSVYVQNLWDYANASSTGNWSSRQLVAMTDARYNTGTKRLKMRGSGLALQLKFTSLDGEPFYLVGWSMMVTGNNSI